MCSTSPSSFIPFMFLFCLINSALPILNSDRLNQSPSLALLLRCKKIWATTINSNPWFGSFIYHLYPVFIRWMKPKTSSVWYNKFHFRQFKLSSMGLFLVHDIRNIVLLTLSHSCLPGINPFWSCLIHLWICCFILCGNMLLTSLNRYRVSWQMKSQIMDSDHMLGWSPVDKI